MTTICIFGNSIVWGAWDIKGGWVSRLKNFYSETNLKNYIYNLGVSGNTTASLLGRLEKEIQERDPSIVIFSIGLNDSCKTSKKTNCISLLEFEDNINEIINRTQKYTKKIIFLEIANVQEDQSQPQIWSTERYFSNKEIKKYNEVLKKICNENNIPLIKTFGELNEGDFKDGIHPNSKGHEKIFEIVKEFLENY